MARRHTRHGRYTKQDTISSRQEQNDQQETPDQADVAAKGAEEEKEQNPVDLPEAVWAVYLQTFLEFSDKEHRRFIKGCEKQIGQLERLLGAVCHNLTEETAT